MSFATFTHTMTSTVLASSSSSVTKDTFMEAARAGSVRPGKISYPLIRRIAGRDCDCWNQLDRGKAFLTSIEQLDQYLFSYGPMTQRQWDQVLPDVYIPPGRVQIVDYGCGQGLASALLFDHFGAELLKRTSKVILVERSRVALTRAESILGCYAPNADVRALHRCLDDLKAQDIRPIEADHTIHLFSNVLDMDSFDHIGLFTSILKAKGSHTMLCVSHNRDFLGGSSRFHEIVQALNEYAGQGWLTVKQSTLREFSCSPKGHEAISLQLRVEVHHGSV